MQSLRDAQRVLRGLIPGVTIATGPAPSLEIFGPADDPPRVKRCALLEDRELRVHDVVPSAEAMFTAFLDGVQESRVVHYLDGVPIVHGRAGAVIRERVARRMTTWAPGARESSALYAPRALLGPPLWERLQGANLTMVDTLVGDVPAEAVHPHELLRRAFHAVQNDRESLEISLAEMWCTRRTDPLFVDGGLPRGPMASASRCCVGVIKSHHTLYVGDEGIRTVLALPEGSRTSVFIVERQWGSSAASWYLRLRGLRSDNPMWGLVRVEVATAPEPASSISIRANEVSGWILAERTPLALPDGRWDTMAYGVRDCEVYLRALSAER
jgi:hypothetical protein